VRRELAFLGLGTGAVMVLATTCARGTIMSKACRYTPTVETCTWEAQRDITDTCLRDCIVAGCQGVRIDCASDKAIEHCGPPQKGGAVGGAAHPIGHDCHVPADEIYWCELPVSERCQAQIAVHELAHTCGWRHGDGLGVPGNNKKISCD
jgi:hypothetical protein